MERAEAAVRSKKRSGKQDAQDAKGRIDLLAKRVTPISTQSNSEQPEFRLASVNDQTQSPCECVNKNKKKGVTRWARTILYLPYWKASCRSIRSANHAQNDFGGIMSRRLWMPPMRSADSKGDAMRSPNDSGANAM